MSYGITDLPTYLIGVIFIVLLPGPNSIYVMSVASRWGIGAGYRGACGIFVGDTILMLLSATGVASLLKTTPLLFMALKYAGALYLGYLGLLLLWNALLAWRGKAPAKQEEATANMQTPFRTALTISLMNPKAILFFISFFVQFVDPGYAYPALSFAILGLICQIASALYLSALILAGARMAAAFSRRRKLSAVASGGIGALFISFGAKLASANLN